MVLIHSWLPSTLIPSLFHTDTSGSVGDELIPLNTISTVITALISGVGGFSCILLLAVICYCVIMLKKTLNKESKVSRNMAAVSKQEEQGPHYEEIPMQNYPIYHTIA